MQKVLKTIMLICNEWKRTQEVIDVFGAWRQKMSGPAPGSKSINII